jgi:peptide deformylase
MTKGLPIRIYGDPVLRGRARPVVSFDDDLRALAAEMVDAMHEGDGIGLAAPQIGRPVRLIVVDAGAAGDEGGEARVLVNPEITDRSPETCVYEEGCLSIPEVRADVERPESITVRYRTLSGEAAEVRAGDLFARVLQHEIDHLDGRLFVDRIGTAERNLLRKKLRELQRRSAEIPRA